MDYRRSGNYYHNEQAELPYQVTSFNEPRKKWPTDGLSFYRAVARHTMGDPSLYEASLHVVQMHYLRVLADDRNPYHAKYLDTFVGGMSNLFNSIGPGMEINDDIMAYNIGDVAGVALVMRFLTTTDDRML